MDKRLIIVGAIFILGISGFFYFQSEIEPPSLNNNINDEVATNEQSDDNESNLFIAPCGYTTPIGQGPYYVAGAPHLTNGNLNYTNREGQTLILSGYVLDGIDDPTPVPNAEIDIWQTDAEGDYHPLGSGTVDNYSPEEIELRGIIKTDESGYYEFTTILPEEYSGRPRHMHLKVRAPGKQELTTQLYWQQKGDENYVSSSDLNPSSRDCQILTAAPEGGTLKSRYDFYLR